MAYAPVNGVNLYYETYGSGASLRHGGLLTIDLSFGPLLEPLSEGRQVIAVELQGHGHTADAHRPPGRESAPIDVTGCRLRPTSRPCVTQTPPSLPNRPTWRSSRPE